MDIELKPCEKCKCGTDTFCASLDYSAKQVAVEVWNRRVEGREITKEDCVDAHK